jgi:hypothetical protein
LALLVCKARPVLLVPAVLLALQVPPEFKGLRELKGPAVSRAQPEQLVSLAPPALQEWLALLGLQDRLALVLVARLAQRALLALQAQQAPKAQQVLARQVPKDQPALPE